MLSELREFRISCSLQSGPDAQNFPAPRWLSSPASAQVAVIAGRARGLSEARPFKLEETFASTAFER